MADPANSTSVPSRRDFFGSAVAERASALIDDIEREWPLNAMAGASDDESAFDAAYERWKTLLDMAEALPCTCREARHAKALALTWILYVDLWRFGWAREDYRTDGRLALDINESMTMGSAA